MSDTTATTAEMVEFVVAGQTISLPLLRWVDARDAKIATPELIGAVSVALDRICALLPTAHVFKNRTIFEESLTPGDAILVVNKYNELLQRSGLIQPPPGQPPAQPQTPLGDALVRKQESEEPINFPGLKVPVA